jgi:formylglycine-generating enzyme required for sulfatase activity
MNNSQVKYLFFWILVGVVLQPVFAGSIANIVERSERGLVIDKGSLDGVVVGQKGEIRAVFKDIHEETPVRMGTFVVRQVTLRTAQLQVGSIDSGFQLTDARFVVFTADLVAAVVPESPISHSQLPASPPETVDVLAMVRKKADKITKNEYGFWEAVVVGQITLIYIPEGEFAVGSAGDDGDPDEHPVHKVFISGYWLARTETSFSQYDRFCEESGLAGPGDAGWGRGNRPVINVSFNDAVQYCRWLAKKTGLPVRLPHEAEWEKAAFDYYPWGRVAPTDRLANFNRLSGRTAEVDSQPAGASRFGFLNLAGNVWEWTGDWYDGGYYAVSPLRDPTGPAQGTERVVRGGCWSNGPGLIRSANRSSEKPTSRLDVLGFRVAVGL